MSINIEIEWKKQPRQIEFLRAAGLSYPFDGGGPKPPQARILMYGGSAGGGKSDTLLMLAFIAAITYPGCNIAIFRREYPQLEGPGGLIMRSHELFNLSVGEDQRSKLAKWHGGKRRWTFFNNSVIQFEHCKTDGDVYNYQCFHPDTEVLTEDGFIPVADLKNNDNIATMNPETREVEYRRSTSIQKYKFDGDLICSSSKRRGVSFAVTPNHTMWAGTVKKKNIRKYRADELPSEPIFPTWAKWLGSKPNDIVFDSIGNNGKSYKFKTHNWAKFLGWFISEGSLTNSLKGGYRIWISQQNKDGQNKIELLLKDMKIKYFKNEKGFCLASKPICSYLEQFGKSANNKKIIKEVKEWSTGYLELLIETLIDGDGTWYKRNKNGQFVTSSKKLADDFTEIAIKCGYRTTMTLRQGNAEDSPYGTRERYHICIDKKGDTRTRNIYKEYYKGDVYCVTVPPHHTVLIRHGGRTMWTGQSQQFDYLLLDESTQFTEYQLQYLMTRNRLTVDGPTQALCGLATNPGGVSHGYHKKMFIECGPPGQPVYVEVQKGKHQVHLFIPSRLSDNQVLEERDPGYRQTLEAMPEDLRKALLEGDWDVFAGKYFREFSREHHVIEPFEIPDHWLRFGSLDWGFAAPASFLWHTIEPSSGRVYTYRELYISKMRAGELAKEILEMSHGELLQYIKISPDAYKEAGLGTNVAPGETVADEFLKVGLNVEPADNRRILGWQRMREYMSLAPDDKPWWQIFNTCSNLIRTLPELTHDKYRVEDISADCEDHAPESARYYLMSRPSPLEGASFYAGSREQFRDMTDDDEDDLHDMGYGGVTFYGL